MKKWMIMVIYLCAWPAWSSTELFGLQINAKITEEALRNQFGSVRYPQINSPV